MANLSIKVNYRFWKISHNSELLLHDWVTSYIFHHLWKNIIYGDDLPDKIYEKEIASDPDLLPELEEFIIELAIKSNLRDDKLNSLALSFSEAASNSMGHGNKLDKNKKVKITVHVTEKKMTVIIKDEGKGFC
mgnify:CR=1 FL=1